MAKRGSYSGGGTIIRAHPTGVAKPRKRPRVGMLGVVADAYDVSTAKKWVKRREEIEAETEDNKQSRKLTGYVKSGKYSFRADDGQVIPPKRKGKKKSAITKAGSK